MENAEQLLRINGLQVTAQRLAVIRAVTDHPHGTADDVADVVRGQIGAISKQTVYDALHVLADHGIIRRIQPAGSAARYEGRVGDNHHHLICRGCQLVVDIDCAVGERPCLTADDDHGFVIDEAEVVFWGYCPTCQVGIDTGSRTINGRHHDHDHHDHDHHNHHHPTPTPTSHGGHR